VSLWEVFDEIWIVDTEYTSVPGEHVIPICLVARKVRSDKEIRLTAGLFHHLFQVTVDVHENEDRQPDPVALRKAMKKLEKRLQ
jgi:hypothetical protein